jgi:hypothetical protein
LERVELSIGQRYDKHLLDSGFRKVHSAFEQFRCPDLGYAVTKQIWSLDRTWWL